MHMHAVYKKCCIANRRSAKRAQGAFDKPKERNAQRTQRIATCRVMSRHVDGTFYARTPLLQLSTAFNLCACSLSFSLSGCDLSGNKRTKYQQLPLFLSRLHPSNDINFRLTALQRVYLFCNNKQRWELGGGRVLGTITLNSNAEKHPSVSQSEGGCFCPRKCLFKADAFCLPTMHGLWQCVLSVCVCVCYA